MRSRSDEYIFTGKVRAPDTSHGLARVSMSVAGGVGAVKVWCR